MIASKGIRFNYIEWKICAQFSLNLRSQTLFTRTNVYRVRLQTGTEKHKGL